MTSLENIRDSAKFRRTLESLCARFSGARKAKVIENYCNRKYLCYVELNSPDLHDSLAEFSGGSLCGDGVLFSVPWEFMEHSQARAD
ncbi:MAG: hypothetical protein IH606_22535 [Burkholderiales bacterium]|nr:hypothetical protein [Burkholderiales bacterium]